MQRTERKGCNYLLTGPGETILAILGAEEAMNAWFVVMIILLGVGALTLHRYDVQRVLIWIAFGGSCWARSCSVTGASTCEA